MTQFQTSIYDLPGQLVQQTMRGNLAPVKSLIAPDSMSPAQRQSLYQSLTGGGFGNRILDTLGEIVTSPWLYLTLATGPVGQQALKSGRGLMEVAASKNAYAKKAMTLLEANGLMMPEAPDDFMKAAVAVQEHLMRNSEEAMMLTAGPRKQLLEYLSQKHGVKTTTLNPDDYLHPKYNDLREELKLIHAAMGAKAHRLDVDVKDFHEVAEWRDSKVMNRNGNYIPMDPKLREHLDNVVGQVRSTPAARIELKKIEESMQADAIRQKDEALRALGEAPTDKGAIKEWKAKRAQIFQQYNEHSPFSLAHEFDMKRVYQDVQGPKVRPDFVKGVVDDVPQVRAYYEAIQDQIRHGYVKMLGDESKMIVNGQIVRDQFHFDETKLMNITTRIRNGESFMSAGKEVQGKELLEILVGSDRSEILWRELDSASRKWAPTRVQNPDGSFRAATKQEIAAYQQNKTERVLRAKEEIVERLKSHLFPDGWNSTMGPRVSSRLERVQTPEGFKHPVQKELSLEEQAQKDNLYGVGRITPRTDMVPEYNTEDLELLKKYNGLTHLGEEHMIQVQESAQLRYANGIKKGLPYTTYTHRLDLEDMAAKATLEMHRAAALDAPANFDLNPAGVSPSHREIGVRRGWTHRANNKVPHSNYTALLQSMRWVQDSKRQQAMKDLHMPALLGLHDEQTLARMASVQRQKEWVGNIAESKIGEMMESYGGEIGRNFRETLRQFAKPDVRPSGGRRVSERLAGLLYMSHMGGNLSMPALNMMQPLISGAQITDGPGMLRAYGRTIKQIFGYAKDRMLSGKLFMPDAERAVLIKKNFENADHIGITPDFTRTIESHVDPTEKPMGRMMRMMMTLFEKSEWFNRVAAHEILKEAYIGAGRAADLNSPGFLRDLSKFSASTQYSGGALYTPPIFSHPKSEAVGLSGWLSNPVAKMFMSFGLRTSTTFFADAPRWGGQENYWKGLAHTGLRSLAISGLVYETGKGLFGVDLSRGLAASGATDVFGGQKALYTDAWYPTPPIVRIPAALLQGLAGDRTELASGLAALIPGGIALSRALSVMPDLPLMGGGLLQKQYADYGNIQPDGTVPVYKPDGTVVGFRKPSELILRGLGVDLGAYNVQSNVDGYLIKQRQEIIRYRHEYLRRLAGNDIAGAEAIKREFGATFQDPVTGSPLPLTVTQGQVAQYLRARSGVGRTERILDSLPPDARPQFAQMLQQGGFSKGVDFTSGHTASQRERTTEGGPSAEDIFLRAQRVGPAAASEDSQFGQ